MSALSKLAQLCSAGMLLSARPPTSKEYPPLVSQGNGHFRWKARESPDSDAKKRLPRQMPGRQHPLPRSYCGPTARIRCRQAPPVLERPLWMSSFEWPPAYGSCPLKPVVLEASLWPIGRPEVAASSSSRTAPPADLGRPSSRIESQLPGADPYSHWRPSADGGDRQVPGFPSRRCRGASRSPEGARRELLGPTQMSLALWGNSA